jgi:serine/threonine protein kinase/tetratricopeptide (TPR) repeat protein
MAGSDYQDNDNTQSFVALTEGAMVSHYRILSKIGAGGMGEVYLAEDTKLKRQVALKFMPASLASNADMRERFVREAQAAAKLDHPNIISVYEVGEHAGRPFFAMAHVEGRSLRDYHTEEKLSIDRIIELGIQICEGLQAAHDKGITHRDIKPSNILIDTHGRARIVDFGLASVQGVEHLTKTGSTLGTVGYMSPEQVRGDHVDHRSDLFSLGVVLYELIARRNPFKRDSEAATLKAVSDDAPEPLARYKANVPAGLQAIIDKALDKDLSTRYQHADGMLADLIKEKRLSDSKSFSAHGSTPRRKPHRWWVTAAVVAVLAVIALYITKPWESSQSNDEAKRIMLAVLPFENLGDPADDYFSDGITDELTSRLATVNGLGIISRTSAMQYKESAKGLREIGKELGVDYVLEGTVRWDKSGDVDIVRITPQLIRVADDLHIWADNYERPLDKVFSVQQEVSGEVISALNVTLLPNEEPATSPPPTTNMAAYDFYLQGNQYFLKSYEQPDFVIALEMFEKAIELDPGFAMAYAKASRVHSWFYWDCNMDCSENRMAMAKAMADTALALQPDLPEGYLALANYYYYGFRQYDSALVQIDKALQLDLNSAELYHLRAMVERRNHNWEQALADLKTSVELNPRAHRWLWDLGITAGQTRRYEESEEYFNRAIAVAPDYGPAYRLLANMYIHWRGDIATARKTIERGRRKVVSQTLEWAHFWIDVLARDHDEAIERLAALDANWYSKCWNYNAMGLDSLCADCCDSALGQLQAQIDTNNHRAYLDHRQLANVFAALGRKTEAIHEIERSLEKLPPARDGLLTGEQMQNAAFAFVLAGEYDRAIDCLQKGLSVPSWITVSSLRLKPIYDPLRDHPRFKALIEKYEKIHGT